jgi:predicted enzyme related to lactoylglutathione lyase
LHVAHSAFEIGVLHQAQGWLPEPDFRSTPVIITVDRGNLISARESHHGELRSRKSATSDPANDVEVGGVLNARSRKSRKRGDGSLAFDDGVGEVSGTWVKGRPPMSDVGILIYIMVDNAADAVRKVVAAGGEITQPLGMDAPEITARFRDPGGNVFGIYQNP